MYNLTGPEAITLAQVAHTITEINGRATTYQQETIEEAYASRRPYGVPEWQLDAWVSTYTAIAAGELALVTDTVERLTGSSPQKLMELLGRS
ncbi:hypothetical protein [Mycobacterium sp. NPDC050441]|uniref:hypothetical protein n=1 Tax=Mycobacterium sp. NPDC050441 TaxID=3155403 RepID=UPI0033C8AF94